MEPEVGESPMESLLRRSRFTAIVSLIALGLVVTVLAPRMAWLNAVITVVAVSWFWLPLLLRSRRRFAEGYRSDA